MIFLGNLIVLPEYAISFFGASLPELTVNIAAVRRRTWGLAFGDSFGFAFVDATVSLRICTLVAPTAMDADRATRGVIGIHCGQCRRGSALEELEDHVRRALCCCSPTSCSCWLTS
jgi:Ca2+/Na+ antiporter